MKTLGLLVCGVVCVSYLAACGGGNNVGGDPVSTTYSELVKRVASDGAVDDNFGVSVAISGDTAIVGAQYDDDNGSSSGSAYIYARNEGGIDNWGEVTKITASDGAGSDNYGHSVSISGDTAIVGSMYDDDNGSNSGSAYIYARNEGGTNNWGEVTKITSSDGADYDNFGRSVAISGDTAIVGAIYDGFNSGSAYIYARNEGGANNWGEVNKITASDGATDDFFGHSVAISGDTAIVGAYQDDDNGSDSGSAYIYARNEGGTDNWGEVTKIIASDGAVGDAFGLSVAISGDTAIAGAHWDADNGSGSGSAYIYARDEGGIDNWGEVTKITDSDGAEGDYFGVSVAISGDTAIVGAKYDDDNGSGSGSVYIYARNEGGTNNWGEVTKITASDGASDEQFGTSVAISGDTAIVGARYGGDNVYFSGSVYFLATY